MSVLSSLTGEMSDSKVAAVFDSEDRARPAALEIRSRLGLRDSQVQVISPHDRHPGRKLLPEGRGIFRTIIIAHYKLGLAGLALGGLLFAVLYAMGVTAIVSSPILAGLLIVGYGGVFGLMVGGLVSLRPDQDPYLLKVRGALKEGNSAVVVHAFNAEERAQAEEALSARGGNTVRTL